MLKNNGTAIRLISCILIVVIIFQFLITNSALAVEQDLDSSGTVGQETSGNSGSTAEDIEVPNPEEYDDSTDGNFVEEIDDNVGTILEPLLELLRTVGDAIMSIIDFFMMDDGLNDVMVKKENLPANTNTQTVATVVLDASEYNNIFGNLRDLNYPNFRYTPEEIFRGNVDILSIDFISGKVIKDGEEVENSSSGWNALRVSIATWYKTLRLIAIIGLLSILIYLGIKIIASSSSGKKAKYKESLISWFIAVALLFVMHYIMAFIIAVVQNFTELLYNSFGGIEVILMDMESNAAVATFTTNFLGLARFQSQANSFMSQLQYFIIYTAFITLTFKFTFIYLKRTLHMAMLTMLAPFVAMMYPLDKANGGKAEGFSFWLREYIYNALLQPLHLVLYMVLIGSAVSLAANNPIYAIVALSFIMQGEKLLKKIFGFGRARGGTVGGLGNAVGAAAFAGSMMGNFKKLRGGNQPNKNGQSSPQLKEKKEDAYDDEDSSFSRSYNRGSANVQDNSGLDIDKSIFNLRGRLTDNDFNLSSKPDKRETEFKNKFEQLKVGHRKKQKDKILSNKGWMENYIKKNENSFEASGHAFQYNDEFSQYSSKELFEKMNDCLKDNDVAGAQKYFDVLNRRMKENRYIDRMGGPKAVIEREKNGQDGAENGANPQPQHINTNQTGPNGSQFNQSGQEANGNGQDAENKNGNVQDTESQNDNEHNSNRQNSNNRRNQNDNDEQQEDDRYKGLKNFGRGVVAGTAEVGRSIIKPVWDTDKNVKQNFWRAGKKLGKTAVRLTMATAALTAEIGIDGADGKISPAGVAGAIAGGAVAGGKAFDKAEKGVKQVLREQNYKKSDEARKKQIADDWAERDDVKKDYRREYPKDYSERKERAKSFVKEGISDFSDQNQIFKYSDYLLRQNKASSKEEADKLSLKTFRYRQNLISNGNYDAVNSSKQRRNEYLEYKVKSYTGSRSAESVKNEHIKLIEQVREFDDVNNS